MDENGEDDGLAVKFDEPARVNYLFPVVYQTSTPKDQKLEICCVEFDGRYYGVYPREVLVVRFGDGFKASVVRAVGEEDIDTGGSFRDYRVNSVRRLRLANKRYSKVVSSILAQLGKKVPRAKTLLEKALACEIK